MLRICRFVRKITRRPAKDEEGAAAVEFALLLPVVVAVLFGIIEFGFIMYTRQVMYMAAREAARSFVTGTSADASEAVTAAGTTLTNGIINGAYTITANVTNLGTATGQVSVTITTTLADAAILNAIPNYSFGAATMTATTNMFVDQFAPNATACSTDPSCTGTESSTTTLNL